MKSLFASLLACGVAVLALFQSPAVAAPLTELLHSFAATGPRDPSDLIRGSDGNFYGTTERGGATSQGTVFKMTSAGVLTTLVEFTGDGATNKGKSPNSLVQGTDGDFYGTTLFGGAGGNGTVFKMTPAGVLTTLAQFTGNGATNKGDSPNALVQGSDGNFYGTTAGGGANSNGTVFKMTAAGTLTTLVVFTGNGATSKGSRPSGKLVQGADGNFYGTTESGGTGGSGTVFKVTPAGALTTLVQFGPGGNAGANPSAGLALGGDGNFYGVTQEGGANSSGTVFQMTPAGTLTTLVEFTGDVGSKKGRYPNAALVLGGDGAFYGSTFNGGATDDGTIFKMTPAGVFTTLVEFTRDGATNKGATPRSALALGDDGNFYGVTEDGGASFRGTVFKMTPAGVLKTLVEFTGNGPGNGGHGPTSLARGGDGSFYGTTYSGGANGNGTIFKFTAGGVPVTLVDFTGNGATNKGRHPESVLVQGGDGNFYGATSQGGASDLGTIFKMTPAGVLTTLVEFTGNGATGKGAFPRSALMQGSDGNFYGATSRGGARDLGTIFKMTPAGALTTLVKFTGNGVTNKGSFPDVALVEGSDGNFYGATSAGGAGDFGTLFKMTPAGALTTLLEFTGNGATNKGESPNTLVRGGGSNFYGTTSGGGITGDGTVFKMTPAGVLTTLVVFSLDPGGTAEGEFPGNLVRASDGNFYGTTGDFGQILFRMTPAGVLTVLADFDFDPPNSGYEASALVQGSDGNLYGAASSGGPLLGGTLFRFRIAQDPLPDTTITSGPSGRVNSRKATFTFISNVAGATFEASLDGGPWVVVASPLMYTGLDQGSHTVKVRAIAAGGTDPTPAMQTWKVDTIPPETTIVSGPSGSPNGSSATFTFVSSKAGSTFKGSLDGAPEAEVSSPLTINFLSTAAHTFSVRAIDNGGMEDPTPATRGWTVTSGGPSPKSRSTNFASGAAVPDTERAGALRAGAALAVAADGVVPPDATLLRLSNQAIDEEGNVVFSAKWTSASGSKGRGIFNAFGSVAEVGGSVPGVDGATFATLGVPVIDGGYVAFLATLAGVPVAKNTALLSDAPTGTLAVVARSGDVAPGAEGAKFKSFESVAVAGSSVAFLGKLKLGSGSPAVTEANDLGVWTMDASHSLTLLLREGQRVNGKKIKTLAAFMAGNGSPGQGRGWLRVIAGEAPQVLALALLGGKTQAVLSADLDGTVTTLSQSGAGGPAIAGASFASYGVPAANAQGHSAFRASLAIGAGGVTEANASGIFLRTPANALYTAVVRTGDPAGTTGAKFTVLKDPVLASDGGVAFPATIKGGNVTGIARRTLWWQPPGGVLTRLAQGGAEAAEIPGAQWESFTSLAIARDRGPIFAATLAVGPGGVTAQNATGVWAVDSTGALQLLFRTGDVIDGKTVQSFQVLDAVTGSMGVTRNFNARGEVLWLATFPDRTQTIIATAIK